MIMYSVYNQLKYFSQIHVNTQMLHDDFGINNKSFGVEQRKVYSSGIWIVASLHQISYLALMLAVLLF